MQKLNLISVVLLLTLAIPAGLAEGDPVSEQRLKSASDLLAIRSEGSKPFWLDADFTAQINVPQNGHLTWKWADKNLWSQEITLGDFRQLNIRKEDTLYISRNLPFTPMKISELQDLIKVFSFDPDEEHAKGMKRESVNGVQEECSEIHYKKDHGNPKTTVCISPDANEVLSIETKDDTDLSRKEFSGYEPFREHRYPRELRLYTNGSLALKVTIRSLRDGARNDADFTPPPGASARRQCEHMTPPHALKTPDPAYPRSASQNRIGGTVTVSLTVLPDGSVENVQLLGSAGREMDQVTEEIVKTWKFKPAMCGDEPVTADIRVNMNFRMR